jgi:uncharacterized protein (TIGR02757 family)
MKQKQNKDELEKKLNLWYEKTCNTDFITADPLQFPKRYKKRQDVEIASFLCAAIAWGKRSMILRSAGRMFAIMGKSPFDYAVSAGYKNLKNQNIHRTFFEGDLKYFCRGFAHCYVKYGSLEKLFSGAPDVWRGIALFREEMAAANGGEFSKHISNPGAQDKNGSACKRLNLALRWLVRGGPVDLGLWKSIKPSELFIPLDVHVARTARELGLTARKANDKKTVIELTEKLRAFCPEDPVKYDFALFGIGVENSKK